MKVATWPEASEFFAPNKSCFRKRRRILYERCWSETVSSNRRGFQLIAKGARQCPSVHVYWGPGRVGRLLKWSVPLTFFLFLSLFNFAMECNLICNLHGGMFVGTYGCTICAHIGKTQYYAMPLSFSWVVINCVLKCTGSLESAF